MSKGSVFSLTSDEKTFVCAARDGSLRKIKRKTKEIQLEKFIYPGRIRKVSVSQNMYVACVAVGEPSIMLFDIDTFNKLHTFEGHTGAIIDITLSQCQQFLYSTGDDCTVRS